MALPLIMGALGVGKAVAGAIGTENQRKAQRRAFQTMSEITPAEREYQKHLRKVAEGGDPSQNQLMNEHMNRVIGNIRQTGQANLQRAEGSIIGQGLENSIVASELRRKVDKDTMRSIAEQSRRISAQNLARQEATKRQAQDRLFQSEMQTDARKQQMQANIAQLGEPYEHKWHRLDSLLNIASAGLEGYMGAGGFDKLKWEQGKDLRESQFQEELNQYGDRLDKEIEHMGSGIAEPWLPQDQSPGYRAGYFWIPGTGYVPVGSKQHKEYLGQ